MKQILIVEDETFIRDLYTQAFSRSGYEVTAVSTGSQAIDTIATKIFDVILLDIMLPNVTGVDVLKVIRLQDSNAKNTPVFLITNLGQDDIIKQAFSLGADGYLLKAQVTPKEMVSEINAFFERKKNESGTTPAA